MGKFTFFLRKVWDYLTQKESKTVEPRRLTETPGITLQIFLSIFGTVAIVFLLGFLYFFYAGIMEKAFAPIKEQELNQFFDFKAFPRAIRLGSPEQFPNIPVILFPSIFFVFAYVTHYVIYRLFKTIKKYLFSAAFLTVILFGFELTIAKKISDNLGKLDNIRIAFLYQGAAQVQEALEKSSIQSDFLNITGIIYLGFISSLLFSLGLYCNIQDWNKVRLLR